MKRRATILAVVLLGLVAGGAAAAFVATTSTGVNTFSTRAVQSVPVITGPRITTNPDCSAGDPASTLRQGGVFYACVESATDESAAIASVTGDLSAALGAGPASESVQLTAAGGPFSGYAYRSAALTATAPLPTGTSAPWSVRAVNALGDGATLSGESFNIRSFNGRLLGEFGAPGIGDLVQYYRLSDTGVYATNAGSAGGVANYQGTPQQNLQPGALVGNGNGAVALDDAADYLVSARNTLIRDDYTVGLWVKGTATSGAGPGAVWSDSAGLLDAGSTSSSGDFGVALDATGRVLAGCGNGETLASPAGALTDEQWHHVVFTRVRTTGAVALYVDGEVVDNSTACNTGAHTGSATVWYGRSHESGLSFTGALDEAMLLSRTLTAAEVRDLYELGSGTG